MLAELMRLPDVNLMRNVRQRFTSCAFLFLLFMLFVSGGILES